MDRHQGRDPSGTVSVEVDRTGQEVRLALDEGWRAQVGVSRLGAAVVHAFAAATTARLAAWAVSTRTAAPPPAAPPWARGAAPPAAGDLREQLRALGRAWRDVREFRIRLAELSGCTTSVTGPGGRVRATVHAGQLVEIAPEASWAGTATDAELVVHVGRALHAALRVISEVPERALEGCPDLRAVLGVGGAR